MEIILDEHVETLSELDCIDEQQAEELLEKYNYPGQVFTRLQYRGVIGGEYEVELPVDVDPETLHREMGLAGMDYYTGKELYLEEQAGDPPDILQYSYPEQEDRRLELLGWTDEDAHYFRAADAGVEVERHSWTWEDGLELLEGEMFRYFPVVRLEKYVDERDWEELREPDYDELREKYEQERVDVDLGVDDTVQGELDDWR